MMKFVAFERTQQGTGASRRLRNSGRTPGIVYGGNAPAVQIELDHNALWHALKKEAFHASILEMELGGQTSQVLLRDVQYHPYKQLVLHVDFQRVDDTTRLRKKVPLHFVGAENSPAVKNDRCLVNHAMNEVEVECYAKALPEFITVDLSSAVKGQTIHLSDLVMPPNTKVVTHGRPNQTVCSLVEPVEEVIAAPQATAKADDKKKGKGKK